MPDVTEARNLLGWEPKVGVSGSGAENLGLLLRKARANRRMKVEFRRHSLGEAEKLELTDTLDSLFLTTGPKTKQFESSFADYLGNAHRLGVTSWTMGNFITLKAMGIGPGTKF